MCFLRQCPVRQQPGVKGSYGEVTTAALHEATRDAQQRGRSRVEAVRVPVSASDDDAASACTAQLAPRHHVQTT